MAKTTSGVYALKNTATGKAYVGSSVNIPRRKRCHYSELRNGTHHSLHLQRSFIKHGEAAFEFVILEETSTDESVIRGAEQRWIDRLDAAGKGGYNGNPCAASVGRLPKSATHKQRIGEARRGQTHTPETKAMLAVLAFARANRPQTAETKAKISAGNSGKVRTPEQRAALSAARTGKHFSPLSEAHKAAISAGKRAAHASKVRHAG